VRCSDLLDSKAWFRAFEEQPSHHIHHKIRAEREKFRNLIIGDYIGWPHLNILLYGLHRITSKSCKDLKFSLSL